MTNKSGIIPMGCKVIVKLQELEEVTKGGIILPSEILEKENAASQLATIVDYGKAAFTIGVGDLDKEWDIKPNVGDTVILKKYAGITIEGIDKEDYQVINDKEILGILNK